MIKRQQVLGFALLCAAHVFSVQSARSYACTAGYDVTGISMPTPYPLLPGVDSPAALKIKCQGFCEARASTCFGYIVTNDRWCYLLPAAARSGSTRNNNIYQLCKWTPPPSPKPRPPSPKPRYPPPSPAYSGPPFNCTSGKALANVPTIDLTSGYLFHQYGDKEDPATFATQCRTSCLMYKQPCMGYLVDNDRHCYHFERTVLYVNPTKSDRTKVTVCSLAWSCNGGRKVAFPNGYDVSSQLYDRFSGTADDKMDLWRCRQACEQYGDSAFGRPCVAYMMDSTRGCYTFANSFNTTTAADSSVKAYCRLPVSQPSVPPMG